MFSKRKVHGRNRNSGDDSAGRKDRSRYDVQVVQSFSWIKER